ncbi:hypothetical protein ABB37_06440 [Leptomonas pyrrhocoris]|uniref:Flagellar attachment zone protein 1 conserved domain-containing protein n=1 Tax=Leptomonas pyrrhocoris TaxID=157538 RepID=A0A0N0VEL7_LEPPY|nr:hypothetical protein ABB37_06440 [Leptomonas pyrrhocoris]KPA78301.1 hypothetical protein ABB37_06440 [Leptomonas pyrrhocoris]|eukprot:XP_015656740.1 hypothetical protein ABB37_06440 [Leptomonas pyrrhocoris]
MENRKLKRYDSAPISSGTSSSSAAAARAAAHISHVPRPQASPSAKPMINASASSSASAAAAAATPPTADRSAEPFAKQLEAYYRCMEEDNQALMKHYETHVADIASLKALAQERKYKEAVFKTMEAKTAAMDAFLQELADLTAPSRGLRARGDANLRSPAGSTPVKTAGSTQKASPTVAAPAASMDSVREAVQQLQASLQAACTNEARHQLTIQALEKELAEWKEKARARHVRTKSGATDGGVTTEEDSCFLPGTAKELREAQRRMRDLERQLMKATTEAKDAAAALALLEQQHLVSTLTLQRRDDELLAMRGLLNSKEQLLAALEEETKTARASTTAGTTTAAAAVTPATRARGSARFVRMNSAPAAAGSAGHRCGGETSSDRLVVTHHYRLLGGQRFVDGQVFSAESFKDAFLRSVSTMLHVPYGYLTSVEVRTHAEAVSVELDIRHSSRVKEDEIDFLLLSHDYPEVMTFLEKVKAELAATTPPDRNAVRVRELQATLAEKEEEVGDLRRKLRAVEESVERRDREREVLDKDVDVTLHETERTVTELYEALQAAQQETQAAQKALSLKSSQARVLEHAKSAVVDAAAAAERNLKQEIEALKDRLAQSLDDLNKAKDSVTEAVLRAQADEKMDVHLAVCSFDIPLSYSSCASAPRIASTLLQNAQERRVLHALVLAYAGCTGGAIPVQVKSCVFSEGSNSGSSSALHVDVELAYYANARTGDAVTAEINRKLSEGGSCTFVQEYLRMRGESARKDATAAADAQRAISEAEQRATAALAAMRAETQHAHATKLEAAVSQLQQISARLTTVFPDSSPAGTGSPSKANSVVGRVEQLIMRVTTAEAAAHRHAEECQRATRRLTEAQQEREQLQQTLSELTARCAEVRLAKEQLAARLATAEDQRTAAQTAAATSEGALAEKVRRLEATLRATTAAAEAEKAKSAEEVQAALAALAARVVEAEAESKRLRAQLTAATAVAGGDSRKEESALREALRLAKEDRTALARQVKEMETDMNDLSNIQAAMQRELESAQQELRAKKHDFDLLVKQLIRMEEKEKKWQSDPHPPVASPDSPSRLQNEEAEKDDVARESLVVLTNSNTNLQQCLRKLQRTMNTMGMEMNAAARGSSSINNSGSGIYNGSASSTAPAVEDNGSNGSGRGSRRSGHRKGALSATVSRAAMDHQQLSAHLSSLLLLMLETLENGLNGSNSDAGAGEGGRTADSAAACTRTASCHSNSHHTSSHHTNPSTHAPTRIVRQQQQQLSDSPFARTRSTPVLGERGSPGAGCSDDDAAAATATATAQRDTPKWESPSSDKCSSNSTATAAAAALHASPTVIGSGGKAKVDAAPRLDFHRQASATAYMRSNTAAAAATTAQSSGGGGGLPPTSCGAANASQTEAKKERRNRELPQRRTGGGAAATGAAATAPNSRSNINANSSSVGSNANAPRRSNLSTTTAATTTAAAAASTAKSNPFLRSSTASGSATLSAPAAAGATSVARVTSGHPRVATSTADAGGPTSLSTSQTHKQYRRRL